MAMRRHSSFLVKAERGPCLLHCRQALLDAGFGITALNETLCLVSGKYRGLIVRGNLEVTVRPAAEGYSEAALYAKARFAPIWSFLVGPADRLIRSFQERLKSYSPPPPHPPRRSA